MDNLSMLGPLVPVMMPLALFMLIPVWIPLIAVGAGAVLDRVRSLLGRDPEPTPVVRLRARRAAEAEAGPQAGRHAAVLPVTAVEQRAA